MVEEGSWSFDVFCMISLVDMVSVFGNIVGKIVKDDVSDIGNIEILSCDGGSNENGGLIGFECVESSFMFVLGMVIVDRGGIVLMRIEEVIESVGYVFCFDKDKY